MKIRFLSAAVAAVAIAFVSYAADEAKKEFDAKCPVSGKPAKEDKTADYLTKKVYFCCDGCPKAFSKDPDKFLTKVNHQLVETGQAKQIGCPFSGGPVKEGTEIEVDGAKVGFCCEKCQAKAEKSDDKLALIFASIKKGFTLQTTCPVSGKPINTEASTEHDGKKVFFCCAGCPAAFEKDPAKFADKLAPSPK